jgi:hypothetical protein
LRCIGNFCSRPCYFLFLFAQHVPLFFFRHQPQSLMFPCSCPFYSPHAFPHPTTVASPILYVSYVFKNFAC